jgi:WD40 repeat protein
VSTIFLSHSSKDNEQTAAIRKHLDAQGYRSIFIDYDPEDGIPAGRDWERELYSQLLASRAVLVLCSEHSMTSDWCFAEITQARALGKLLIPLKIAPCTVKSVLRDLQILDFTGRAETNYESLWQALARAGLDPRDSFQWDPKRPPFPGLRAFDEADAAVYFGRETNIQQVSDLLGQFKRLNNGRLALVLGASGSGKSSLVQAGLLPRLRKNAAEWIVVEPFRPQERPLSQFALALGRTFERYGANREWREIRGELEAAAAELKAERLLDLAYDLRQAAKQENASVLVTIDQMEELLAAGTGESRDSFESVIQQIAAAPESPFILLGCLRSDLLAGFQTRAPWNKLAYVPVPLNAMSLDELPAVIERPAQLAGLALEPGLVQAIVIDAETPDAMPLLAFTLRELWELAPKPTAGLASGGRLTLHQYRDELGGLKTLLARKADEAIARDLASHEVAAALRSAFSMLVRIDENGGFARRPAPLEELPAAALPAIQRLIQSRVLTARGDGNHSLVEVAHEALFRTWGLLAGWLEADAEFLQWNKRLQTSLGEWQRTAQDDGALLRGAQLAEALEWLKERPTDVGEVNKEFIEASVSLMRRDREALEFREWKAKLEAGRALYERSFALSDQARYQSAAACVLRAVEIAPLGSAPAGYGSAPGSANWASESWTRYRYLDTQRGHMAGRLVGHERAVTSVAVSADGSLAVSGGLDGSVRRWNLKEAKDGDVLISSDAPISCVALNADGSTFVYADVNGNVQETEMATGKRLWSVSGEGEPVSGLSFSSDGLAVVWGYKMGAVAGVNRGSGTALMYFRPHQGSVTALMWRQGKLVTGSSLPALAEWLGDGTIQVWDVAANERTKLIISQLGQNITAVAINAGGTLALRGFDNGSIELLDLQSGEQSLVLAGHNGAVTTLAFGEDNQTALSGSADHLVRWWDLKTGACMGVLEGHTEPVLAVSICGVAKIALSASTDGSIAIWDLRQEMSAEALSGHTSSVETVCIRSDGKRALSGATDGTARLWDLETRQTLQVFGKYVGPVSALSLSSDGQSVVSGNTDGHILVWNVESGKVQTVLEGHSGTIWDVACSADGSRVFSASEDNTARIWALETGQLLHTLVGHSGTVYTLAGSVDGKALLTGSADGTLRLWDTNTGSQKHLWSIAETAKRGITSIAWSADGRIALIATSDHIITVWDLTEGKVIWALKGHEHQITGIVFIPDSNLALSASLDHTLRLWDFVAGRSLRVFKGHTDTVRSVALSGDGKTAISGSRDETLMLWSLETGKQLAVLKGHTEGVMSVAFSRDGEMAISGSLDKTLRVWNVARGQVTKVLCEGHSSAVEAVAFAGKDGELAVTGSRDGTIRIWDGESGRQIRDVPVQSKGATGLAIGRNDLILAGYGDKSRHVWEQLAFGALDGRTSLVKIGEGMIAVWDHRAGVGVRLDRAGGEIASLCLDAAGKRILCGSYDGTARILDVAAQRQVRIFHHPAAVWSTAYDEERKLAICGCIDGSIQAWDTESGKPVRSFVGHTGGVGSLALCPDGETFLSASSDRTIRRWRISDGEQTAIFKGHKEGVITVAVSGDGRLVASGSVDGAIALWDLVNGEEARFLVGSKKCIWSLAFVPNSSSLFSASGDGTACLWDTHQAVAVRTFKSQSGTLTAGTLSNSGELAFLAAEDGSVSVHEVATGNEIGLLRGNTSAILSIASAAAKDAVAIGCANGVRLWTPESGADPVAVDIPVSEVLTAALDPAGEIAAIGCADGLVWLWSLNGECFGSLHGHSAPVTSSAFSYDGRLALAGSLDGTVRIWDTANRKLVRVLGGPAKGVTSIGLCPDGQTFLAGYADGVTRLWDFTTGKLLRSFAGDIATSLATSKDGSYALFTATGVSKTGLVAAGEGGAGLGLALTGPEIQDVGVLPLLNSNTPRNPPCVYSEMEDPFADFASLYKSIGLRVIREGAGLGDIEPMLTNRD